MEHDEDYFSYGTPVQEEVETVTGQYAKEKKDPAVTRSLPVWQQVGPECRAQFGHFLAAAALSVRVLCRKSRTSKAEGAFTALSQGDTVLGSSTQ